MNVLAIDLGGTSSKCAVFSEKKLFVVNLKLQQIKQQFYKP